MNSYDVRRSVNSYAAAWVRALLAACAAVLLITLLSQFPAQHDVDVGGYDAAYVQGFFEPERPGSAYLADADGAVRWSRPEVAVLRFPLAGTPGTLRVRLRGWSSAGGLPVVTLWLNGSQVLAQFQTSGAWEEHVVALDARMLKANDFFVQIDATPSTTLTDGRQVGVLVDSATYTLRGPFVWPAASQLVYAGLIGALLAGLLASWRQVLAALFLYGLLWLIFYHGPPPLYPYPLRGLPPAICLALAGLLLLRIGPDLVVRWPRLLTWVAPGVVVLGWTAAILLAAEAHVTLARPGVENDFRVFATRESLAQVLQADGFYNLGYPFLLWLVRPFTDQNAFLAGRVVAALSGAVVLAAGYGLARAILPPGAALVALITMALSGFVAQYGLYVGSDMPFAAALNLAVALLVWGSQERRHWGWVLLAGMCGGLAFLMRHLGLVVLIWGLGTLWLLRGRAAGRALLLFGLGFGLVAAPQVLINTMQTGSPLYNQQAKNVWLAVYADTDWGRWDEVPNTIGLTEVILADPVRFLTNWGRNVVGFLGSGAEDTSEFGRADQLRLLGWPANWLALGGLVAGILGVFGRRGASRCAPTDADGEVGAKHRRQPSHLAPVTWRAMLRPYMFALCGLILLYVALVGMAFILPRFFLPLVPIYALGAAAALHWLTGGGRRLLGVGLVLSVVLWGGWSSGVSYALGLQPADEVAAIQMVLRELPADARLAARVPARIPLAKYSAIAHRVVAWPNAGDTADLDLLRQQGAEFLLWDATLGLPPLDDPQASQVSSSGRYRIYRLGP
ncbi:glycosyltransferase family 39 protein [Candidatus Oscillochloris fontis]|uniref:glycosyltransferase family 39 protein n=1 Tax=Candidatus Oscillochloris fontis TaxID=2496868 RepID=UPI001EE8B08A|nr:glycosyltransferase family 39 protein [Candidatus Oscillochloris fontis]